MSIRSFFDLGTLRARQHLSVANANRDRSLARLSSGRKLNRAADDAAGLGISNRLSSQLRGLRQASRNANDGVGLLQTAEGAMSTGTEIVSRMKELAVTAANATMGSQERGFLQNEMTSLGDELTRISEVTEFNQMKLLDGSATSVNFQIGATGTADDYVSVAIDSIDPSQLGTGTDPAGISGVDISTSEGAQRAMSVLDDALNQLANRRAKLGAVQNRLHSSISNVTDIASNLEASISRIRDADVASEQSSFTSSTILSQAGIAVLSQAQQLPRLARSLLK